MLEVATLNLKPMDAVGRSFKLASTAAMRFTTELSGLKRWFFTSIARRHEDTIELESDHILKGHCWSEDVDLYSIKADDLVREAQRRHRTSHTATAVLGHAMMGTLLLNSIIHEAETVKMTLVGDGPLGYLNAVSTRKQFSKAYAQYPECSVPPMPDGTIDVKTALGNCEMHLIFDFPQWKQTSKLYKFLLGPSGDLGKAIAFFLTEEEKMNSAARFGVTFDEKGIVKTARGFVIELYPLSDKTTSEQLRKNLSRLPSLLDNSVDMDGREMILRLLQDIRVGGFDKPIVPQFGPCDVEELKSQLREALAALGLDKLTKFIENKEYMDLRCEFTTEVVRLEKDMLDGAVQDAEDKAWNSKAPETVWLDSTSKYVGDKPDEVADKKEEEKKDKKPFIPYDGAFASRIAAIRKDSFTDHSRRLPRSPEGVKGGKKGDFQENRWRR